MMEEYTQSRYFSTSNIQDNDSDSEMETFEWTIRDCDGVGDTLNEEKPNDTLRIYFQNLNGLKWDNQGGSWPMICQAMAGIQADIGCFSEINQDTGKFEIYDKMRTIAQKQFEYVKLVTATTKRQVKRNYKPGGTAMLMMMEVTSYVQETTRDRMGRWISTRLASGNGNRLTVIGAYQVCQTKRTGRTTIATQQINTLLEESVTSGVPTRINPREAFIRDLIAFISQRQQEGDMIILGGDFNEEIDDDSGMAQVATSCNLIDLFCKKFETSEIPSTYQRGPKRLDYILLTPELEDLVNSTGYEPFDYRGITTDHRGMFLDLQTKTIFGNSPIPLAHKQQREFTATDPQAVKDYIEAKWKELIQHNLTDRIRWLETTREPDHDFVERLDKDMFRAATIATKTIKQNRRYPWSPKLAKAWAAIHYYKMHLSQLKNTGIDLTHSITKWKAKHSGLPPYSPVSIEEAENAVKDAYRNLRKIRQEATKHRKEFLDMKADLYATLQDQAKERIIERMKNAESLHNAYTKLKRIRQEDKGQGLTSIQIPIEPNADPKTCPKDDAYWQTIRDPTLIEEYLIKRNQQHFGQAQGTPLTTPRVWDRLHYDGSGEVTTEILSGTYTEEALTETSQLLIDHMTARTTHQCSSIITNDEFIGKLRNWRETTTTSPSGLHLGHYHALWRPAAICKEDRVAMEQFDQKRKWLIRAHLAIINYTIRFAYPLLRWRKVINIMLEKDPGQPKIHRLRVIHIYEADYNMMLATKWREAMHHAEDNHLLNDAAYGSRPARSAHDPIMLEVWRNGIYQTSMKSGVNQDLDATSCYDRILPPVASVCSQRMGIHPKVAEVNCTTLQKANFHLKTNLGVSKASYRHTFETPIYGTGQGSGNSPHIWCFISSTLFDAYNTKAHGAEFTTFNGKETLRMGIVGYVDDCTQIVNEFSEHPQPTPENLVQKMQHDSQLWNDLLWTTGGALELPKCSFQMIQSEHTPKGEPFLRGGLGNTSLIVTNNIGNLSIKQTSNYTSRKSLGVYLNPAGQMKTQVEILRRKSEYFKSCIAANVLTRKEAVMMFHGIIIPSLTYPMAATNLTEDQCTKIETPFLKVLLPNAGYNRMMSKAIRQAPTTWGGAGFSPLYGEQTVATILTAMRHLRSKSNAGRMLYMNLTWAQAYSGLSKPLWEHPDVPCPTIPNPWIMGVRKALQKIKASIILEEPVVGPYQRENDWFIMDRAMAVEQLKKDDITCINACRRYLQCTTAADVCNSKGTHLLHANFSGQIEISKEEINGECFNQVKPNQAAWRAWRKFWKTQLEPQTLRLRVPLRSWIVQASQCRRRPEWLWCTDTRSLMHRRTDGKYQLLINHNNRYRWNNAAQVVDVASKAYPVHVIDLGHEYEVQHNYRIGLEATNMGETWNEFVLGLDEWERNLLSHVRFFDDPKAVMHKLNQHPAFVASDGSVIQRISGSYGMVLATQSSGERLIKIMGAAPGFHPSSFRAEAYGALATIRCLWRLQQFTKTTWDPNLQHWIDNDALLRRTAKEINKRYNDPYATLQPDWDVVQKFVETWQALGLDANKYKMKWVKSHQDDSQSFATLPLEAQLNCEADTLAGQYQQAEIRHRSVVPMIQGTQCHLQIDGHTVTTRYKQSIREALTLPPYFEYLEHRFGWTPAVREMVDWEVFKRILGRFRKGRPTIVKHLHDMAPTGKYVHRYDRHQPANCPACEEISECNQHLLACNAASRREHRSKFKNTLRKLQKGRLNSDPILWIILAKGLKLVYSNSGDPMDHRQFPSSYHSVIQQQNQIGWNQIFKGRWGTNWKLSHEQWQQENTNELGITKGADWVASLGMTFLQDWIDLWLLRNEERHSRDESQQQSTFKTRVRSQMDDIYSKKDRMCPVDRGIIPYDDVDTHMKEASSLDALQDWCLDTYPAVMASIRQATTLGVQRNGRIEDYFSAANTNQ